MVRSMMSHANLPISFWKDALLTAAYILNHVSSKFVSSTPYELFILNILKDLYYLLVKKLMEEWWRFNHVVLYS
jgi:hypothetical protein